MSPQSPVCCLVTASHLAQLHVFAEALARWHAGPCHCLLIDSDDLAVLPEGIFGIRLLDIIDEDSWKIRQGRFTPFEAIMSLKPRLIRHVLEKTGRDCIYLDTDVLVLQPFAERLAMEEGDSILLTPHLNGPLDIARQREEIAFLLAGVFNAGVIGLAATGAARAFLEWWDTRCHEYCLNRQAQGLFADQRWLDLAPTLFRHVTTCTDPGINLGHWRIGGEGDVSADEAGRLLYAGTTIALLHLSGFDPLLPDRLSRHSTLRLKPASAFGRILREYGQQLLIKRQAAISVIRSGPTSPTPQPGSPPHRLVLFSPWATRCGIAEYSRNLISEFGPGYTVRIYCDSRTPASSQQSAYQPTWEIGNNDTVCATFDEILLENPAVLLIQHQPSLFGLTQQICERLAAIREQGCVVILELHASLPLAHEEHLSGNSVPALRTLDQIIVHKPEDEEHLRTIGLAGNTHLLPHGVTQPWSEALRPAQRGDFGIGEHDLLLGGFGFALPHKGIDTLIECITQISRASQRPVRLIGLYSALDSRSEDFLHQCQALARSLGVDRQINWITDWRPIEECVQILGMADYIVFPYKETQESASGAATAGLAALRPVLVSPRRIFSDLSDCTWRMTGDSVTDVVDAVCAMERNPRIALELLDRQRKWLADRSWSRISAQMDKVIRELLLARQIDISPSDMRGGKGKLRQDAASASSFPPGFGINLFGQFTSATGLGVTARHTAKALRVAGVPFACFDIKAYYPTGDVVAELADISAHITNNPSDLRFPVNLYCMPATDYPQLVQRIPHLLQQARFHVAVVWWETTKLHASWAQALIQLDALVSYSEFLAGVLANSLPLTPVITGRQPLFLPDGIRPDRARFGLPAEATVFVSSFDPSSDPARKNPAGVITAFRRAFPRDQSGARLVFRLNNADATDMARQTSRLLIEAAGGDGRISFSLAPMDYRQVLALYASADVYVSLHRSEGLGLGMLEAMRLGIPVIATAWSGNMTFMDHRCARLVRYRLIQVSGNHPFYRTEVLGPDAVWADPVIEDAVAWMKHLHSNPGERRRLGKLARMRAERYQEDALALDWLHEVAEIWRSARYLAKVEEKLSSTTRTS
jgi:glycosyltransferase involved in cell wall biosynthesis